MSVDLVNQIFNEHFASPNFDEDAATTKYGHFFNAITASPEFRSWMASSVAIGMRPIPCFLGGVMFGLILAEKLREKVA